MTAPAKVRCPSCEEMVRENGVHSCYNARHVAEWQEARDAVVNCAREFVRAHGVFMATPMSDRDAFRDASAALDAAEGSLIALVGELGELEEVQR